MTKITNIKLLKKPLKTIPIFFAADDNYVPFLAVSIKSMLDNASKYYFYNIYILTEGISIENQKRLEKYQTQNSKIHFVELSSYITKIKDRLASTLRDYYTESIFYRIFIAALHPELKKAIYLDCDIVVLGDISKLYNTNLGDNILGAVTDDVISGNEDFKIYAKYAVGVDHTQYFNSGVLVMNLEEYRKQNRRREQKQVINDVIRPKYTKDDINPERRKSVKGVAAEEMLLSILLQHPDYIDYAKENLARDKMLTDLNRRIYTCILEAHEDSISPDISIFAQSFTAAEVGYIVSLQNSNKAGNIVKTVLKDCIKVILEENTLLNFSSGDDENVEDWASKLQEIINIKQKGNE